MFFRKFLQVPRIRRNATGSYCKDLTSWNQVFDIVLLLLSHDSALEEVDKQPSSVVPHASLYMPVTHPQEVEALVAHPHIWDHRSDDVGPKLATSWMSTISVKDLSTDPWTLSIFKIYSSFFKCVCLCCVCVCVRVTRQSFGRHPNGSGEACFKYLQIMEPVPSWQNVSNNDHAGILGNPSVHSCIDKSI